MKTSAQKIDGPLPAVCTSSSDCIKVLSRDGIIRHFNEDGIRLMELDSIEKVRGLFWPELWPEESRSTVRQSLESVRQSGVATFSAFCPTARGNPKWWDVTLATMPGAEGDIIVISRDVTDRRAALDARETEHDRLSAIIRSNTDVLWDIDLINDRVWWGEGMTSTFGYGPDQIGESTLWCHDHIHPDDRQRIVDSMAQAVQSDMPSWEDEFRYRKADGDYIHVYDRGTILRDRAGKALRFVGVMQDISSHKAVVEAHKALAGEMAHRVNNVLAVVSGLFQQSLTQSDDMEGLASSFGSRLRAMATANTAIMRTAGHGASLQSIAHAQLDPFVGTSRLSLEGEDVVLPERLAQPLALAFNELATNALKYGALSNDDGKVSLSWTVSGEDRDQSLSIQWTERGGPPVATPTRTGLGSRLIERGIPGSTVQQRFAPEGFTCSISVRLPGHRTL